jgi:hypothetical protein
VNPTQFSIQAKEEKVLWVFAIFLLIAFVLLAIVRLILRRNFLINRLCALSQRAIDSAWGRPLFDIASGIVRRFPLECFFGTPKRKTDSHKQRRRDGYQTHFAFATLPGGFHVCLCALGLLPSFALVLFLLCATTRFFCFFCAPPRAS